MKTASLAALLVGLTFVFYPARCRSDEPPPRDASRAVLPEDDGLDLPSDLRLPRLSSRAGRSGNLLPFRPPLAASASSATLPFQANPFSRMFRDGPATPAPAFPAAMPPPDVRLPAEFERQEAILLAYRDLADTYPTLFIELITQLQPRVRVVVLVDEGQSESLDELLADNDLGDMKVERAAVPHDTMWARDYGPIVVGRKNGERIAVDTDYLQFGRPLDDAVPPQFAAARKLPVVPVGLALEGGNLISNGNGLLLSTTACLESNADQGRDEQFVRRCLRMCFGGETMFLEPLSGEATGHVDMFATFTSPDTVVLGAFSPAADPENAAILNRNAERLSRVTLADGKRLRVVRIPMPPSDDGVWRSYANVVMANGLLLMPAYRDAEAADERAALETYRRLLPAWRIVPIDATEVIEAGGALHCLTRNIPAKSSAPAAGDSKSRKPPAPGSPLVRRRMRVLPQPPRG